ncbi:MAG: Rne/Rng family ribonuclease [Bacteroidales bacterium]|nr:Rne/Rng family ribonuclease [Bacteroidales bacterium]MBQ4477030.1 Rne/Rng family ribonuclease [Bacteroidales bacterium]MBR4452944.1 Rne/Rng family ribonuclease [Bacteroidales bacterium]
MSKELFIGSDENEVKIALLEDKILVELHKEKTSDDFRVGDIYIGRVKRIIPGLNAAFIDIGHEKDAFLHYLDLGPNILTFNKYVKNCLNGNIKSSSLENIDIEPQIAKTGKIKDVLSVGDLVLVQIAKEAISTKGPRLTGEISLAGRYSVLVPFSDKVMLSQKIAGKDERNRLRKIMTSIKAKNMGIIVRTVAKDQSMAVLHADMRAMMDKWKEVVKHISGTKFPKRIISELDKVSTILRDMLNDTFDAIYVGQNYFQEVKSYINTIAPEKLDIIKLHKGNIPIFEYYGIDKQIKSSFGKSVSIRGGIYLVIEHTEAMHVIDVNSGHRVNSEHTQEDNALEVNIQAAKEIARQLRLRDMGGIIIVDFIDMRLAEHRKELYTCMVDAMNADKARHTILPINKFGLIQITRQRVRPAVDIEVRECCPSCNGTGMVRPPVLIVDDIENNLQLVVERQKEKKLTLEVHPFLYAYLHQGLISKRWKWMWKYKCRLKIVARESFQFLEYRFFSDHIGEINFWMPTGTNSEYREIQQ